MSRLGASHTNSTRAVASVGAVGDDGACGNFADLLDVIGEAHWCTLMAVSPRAIRRRRCPRAGPWSSYFVTGRVHRDRQSVRSAVTRRSRGSASPTSAICSAYPAWSVAACSTPPGRSRSAISATVAGCSSRRLWWRAFGQGSGKKTRTPVSESGPNMCSSTSMPSPRISRTLRNAFAVDCAEQLRQPPPVHLDGDHVEVWFGLRHRQRRRTGPAADLQHDGCRASEPRLGVQRRGGSIAVTGLLADLGPQPVPRRLLAAGQRRAAGAEAGDAGVQVFRCGGVVRRR